MIFALEDYYDVIAEITPLAYAHHEEVDLYQGKVLMDPDFDTYGMLQDSGVLKIFTLRNDNELIGYNIFYVQNHPHYKGTLWAGNDLVYIDPAFRNTGTTPSFFNYCEESLRDMGAGVISYTMKVDKAFHSLMLLLEMDHAEQVYTKYIGQ